MISIDRERAIYLLFSSMVDKLDEMNEKGIKIPSDVYVQLGMLQGNISGLMNHIAINHDTEMGRIEDLLREHTDLLDDELASELAENDPNDDTVEVEPDLSRRNVVRLRDE